MAILRGHSYYGGAFLSAPRFIQLFRKKISNMNIALKAVKIHSLYHKHTDQENAPFSLGLRFGVSKEDNLISCSIEIETTDKSIGITVESFFALPKLPEVLGVGLKRAVFHLSYGITRGIVFSKMDLLMPLLDINDVIPDTDDGKTLLQFLTELQEISEKYADVEIPEHLERSVAKLRKKIEFLKKRAEQGIF